MSYPVAVEGVWIAPEVAKVLHHHERLVEILVVDRRALDQLPQHLRPRLRARPQSSYPGIAIWMRDLRRTQQRVPEVRFLAAWQLTNQGT